MNRLHATHRKDLLCIPDPVKLEVGDPNGLSQPLVMAVPQALHKLAIREAICDEPWPVLLVEAQLLNAQALQALPASSAQDWSLSHVLMQTSFAWGVVLAFMKLCAMAKALCRQTEGKQGSAADCDPALQCKGATSSSCRQR